MATIFTRIIQGEIPCYKILENDSFLAILDAFPLVEGHTLVIPKIEVDYIFDLDDSTLADLMVFSKRVSKALRSAIPCKRIGMTVIGLEVPHTHIHLVPLQHVGDMNFNQEKLRIESRRMEEITNRIKTYL